MQGILCIQALAENGEYENYLIDCELMGNIATATNDYCKIGDVVDVVLVI